MHHRFGFIGSCSWLAMLARNYPTAELWAIRHPSVRHPSFSTACLLGGLGGGGGAGGGFGFETPGSGRGETALSLSTRLGRRGGGCGAFCPISIPPNEFRYHLRLIS